MHKIRMKTSCNFPALKLCTSPFIHVRVDHSSTAPIKLILKFKEAHTTTHKNRPSETNSIIIFIIDPFFFFGCLASLSMLSRSIASLTSSKLWVRAGYGIREFAYNLELIRERSLAGSGTASPTRIATMNDLQNYI